MGRPSDTRQLIREAYPHVLAAGHSLTVTEIKATVRKLHPELPPTWNPSNLTAANELETIARELGERILLGGSLTDADLPEPVARALNSLGMTVWKSAAGEASAAFDAERQAFEQRIAEATVENGALMTTCQDLRASASEMEARHDQEVGAFLAELDGVRAQLASAQEALVNEKASHTRTGSLLRETEAQLAARTAELAAQVQQGRNDAALAAERYDGLVKTNAAQLDGVRQSRNEALKEAAEWKAIADRREGELTAANRSLREASSSLGDATGRANALKEQLERRVVACDGLERKNAELGVRLTGVRDALKRLTAHAPGAKTTAADIVEKLKAIQKAF